MLTLPPLAEMDRAFRNRDATYDGLFFVAVRTTRIFCLPSCPARKPLPENVEFYPSVELAAEAGFRACKRCRPMELGSGEPGWVQRLHQAMEEEPEVRLSDRVLGEMGIDPVMARRWFRKHYGMTFQSYQRNRRLGIAKDRLEQGSGALEAGLDAGFESSSGFRDAFRKLFGEPPGRGRTKDRALACWVPSPLGPLLAAAKDEGVVMLEFLDRRGLKGQLDRMQRWLRCALVPGRNETLHQLEEELTAYFAGELRAFRVPLLVSGTGFQESVWKELRRIPYGELRSYSQIAEAVGRPGAVRAVGRANGMNRLAILLPCHRVVRKDGSLCGYGGGLWRKRFLLDLEQSVREGLKDAPADGSAAPPSTGSAGT